MEGSFNKSNKKRKGSSQGREDTSKRSASEVEEAMILDENESGAAACCPDKTQHGSYLGRIVEMVDKFDIYS